MDGNTYPIHSDVMRLNRGLFKACENGPIGCAPTAMAGTVSTCGGPNALDGTGYDATAFQCNSGDLVGAGTDWLTISGNVVPGELIALRFVLWDTGDGVLDSVVLLDAFEWKTRSTTPAVLRQTSARRRSSSPTSVLNRFGARRTKHS